MADLVAVQVGAHPLLEVGASLRRGLHLAREYEAHPRPLRHLDGEVLSLLGADAGQGEQIAVRRGALGGGEGVEVHSVVDPAGPAQTGRQGHLGAGDRHQFGGAPQFGVELRLAFPDRPVDRVQSGQFPEQGVEGDGHDPSAVIVDDGSRAVLPDPLQDRMGIGQVEPALLRSSQVALVLRRSQRHRAGDRRSLGPENCDLVPAPRQPLGQEPHHQLDSPVSLGGNRIPGRRDQNNLQRSSSRNSLSHSCIPATPGAQTGGVVGRPRPQAAGGSWAGRLGRFGRADRELGEGLPGRGGRYPTEPGRAAFPPVALRKEGSCRTGGRRRPGAAGRSAT